MAYTETTSTSWASRLGGSFRGIGFGIFLFVAGTGLLWWNEGNFVRTGDALGEAQTVTQELGDIATVNAALNGKLVHATGLATTKDVLTDTDFQISTTAIRLTRAVEFYQWMERSKSEKRKKLGGGEETVTTYTYELGWAKSPVNSSAFRDPSAVKSKVNTVLMPLKDNRLQAKNVTFGAYRLPDFLVGSMGGATNLAVSIPDATRANLNKQLAPPAPQVIVQPQQQAMLPGLTQDQTAQTQPVPVQPAPVQQAPQQEMIHVSDNTVYVGPAPASPRVGDVRITYTEVRPATVSILAKLNGSTFEVFRASNGKTVSSLSMGESSLENMYGSAHSSNSTMTWILRVVGVFLVIFGLKMLVAPIAVLADVIPIMGTIVGAGLGMASTLIGLAWSLLVASIAWLRFRPMIGGIMVLLAVGLIALLVIKGRSGKAAKASPAE